MLPATRLATYIAPANWRPAHEGVDFCGGEVGRPGFGGIVARVEAETSRTRQGHSANTT